MADDDKKAGAKKAEKEDPTLGGAIPDPNDDSPRGRFARGEIDARQLDDLLKAERK